MKNANTHGMDCLTFCLRGMNENLFEFAKTGPGKGILRVLKTITPTLEGRMKEYIWAANITVMSQALAQIKGLPLTLEGAVETIASPEFNHFEQELRDTIDRNFPLLMSKLTRQQRKRLESLAA